MPRYHLTAKSQKGETYSAIREAKDEYDLARALRQEGYILISAAAEQRKRLFKLDPSLFSFLGGVSFDEKMAFMRNLRVMVRAGVSLPKALNILSRQTKSKKFRKSLGGIENEIIKGESFSNALGKYPYIFSEFICSMISVGEESGTLENSLAILARQMERERDLKTKIQSAMIYPAVIISAMMGIGAIMLITVIPQLAKTFEEFDMKLPLTTRFIIGMGNFLAEKWHIAILIIIILIFLIRVFFKTKRGRELFSIISLKMPVISPIIKKINSAHVIRNLSSLTAAGIPLLRSLEIISKTLGNFYYQQALFEAIEKIKKGEKLSAALRPYQNLFSLTVMQMIEVGEETGETSDVLEKLGDFFEEEVATATKNLVTIIEPMLMLIIGGAVGFFAISMIQPMYTMLQGIK